MSFIVQLLTASRDQFRGVALWCHRISYSRLCGSSATYRPASTRSRTEYGVAVLSAGPSTEKTVDGVNSTSEIISAEAVVHLTGVFRRMKTGHGLLKLTHQPVRRWCQVAAAPAQKCKRFLPYS